jgi:hypothetical protein
MRSRYLSLGSSRNSAKNLSVVFALALGAPMICTAGETAKDSLRWNLREGDQLRLKVTQETKTDTSVKGKATAMSIDTGLEMVWNVDSVDQDGTMRTTQAFDRVMMKTTGVDGQAIIYDSSSKEELPADIQRMDRDIRPLLGSRFAMAMSNRGEILEVTQEDEPNGETPDGPNVAIWKNLLTKDGINRTLRQALGRLPEDPVAEGDKWSSSHEVDSPLGKIRIVNDFTYEGTVSRNDRHYAKITMIARVELQRNAGAPDAPAMPMPEQYGGVFYFDNVAGRLVHSEITQKTESEVPYKDTAIKVSTSSTIVLSVTKVSGG